MSPSPCRCSRHRRGTGSGSQAASRCRRAPRSDRSGACAASAPGAAAASVASPRLRRRRLEVELTPGRPPVVGARDDLARLGDLDARTEAQLLDLVRRVEVDGDLARSSRVVRFHGLEILKRLARPGFDPLARGLSGKLARAEAAEALLHGDGGETLAEELAPLAA